MLGVSQANLADALGITFQQVQKYEHGSNRVSASMLCRIGATLKCRASSLLGESDTTPQHGASSPSQTVQAVRMLEAFQSLSSDDVRRQVADLVVALATLGVGAGSDLRAEILAIAASSQTAAPSPRAAKRAQARTGRPTKAKDAALVKLGEAPPAETTNLDKKARPSRVRRLRADKDVPWLRRSKRKPR